jgi:hypothetical protein
MDTKSSSISHVENEELIGQFWDDHDFTDLDNPELADVPFVIACAVPIEAELFAALEKLARRRGVQVETLVNLWLQQKLLEAAKETAA